MPLRGFKPSLGERIVVELSQSARRPAKRRRCCRPMARRDSLLVISFSSIRPSADLPNFLFRPLLNVSLTAPPYGEAYASKFKAGILPGERAPRPDTPRRNI